MQTSSDRFYSFAGAPSVIIFSVGWISFCARSVPRHAPDFRRIAVGEDRLEPAEVGKLPVGRQDLGPMSALEKQRALERQREGRRQPILIALDGDCAAIEALHEFAVTDDLLRRRLRP